METVSIMNILINLFGGLAIFLFGMKMMGDGLQNASKEKLKALFSKLASNRIAGVATGAVATALVQSSSATTVMVVGFVNASLMTLAQAAAIIMGANIGTTITAQMISLDLGIITSILLAVGGFVYIFAKNDKYKQIAMIIFGFGILFLGMDVMKDGVAPLRDLPVFMELMVAIQDNLLLGVLIGMFITVMFQSSSATTGMLVGLAAAGAISLEAAVPMLLGSNIGTCITAMLASIGANKTAKKAALIHLIFNLAGAIIFIPLTSQLIAFVSMDMFSNEITRQIANVHTIFNIANTLILLPFIGVIVKIADKLIPEGDEEEVEIQGTKFLDKRILETPSIAMGQLEKEIIRMHTKAIKSLKLSRNAFIDGDKKALKKVEEVESLVNLLEDEITQFMVEVNKADITQSEKSYITSMYHVINDIERIADHAENIAELASEKMTKKLTFSDNAVKELDTMIQYAINATELSLESLMKRERATITKVVEFENQIDSLEKELRGSHIKRLNDGTCNASIGAIFLDAISNIERVGDHANNIALSVSDLIDQ